MITLSDLNKLLYQNIIDHCSQLQLNTNLQADIKPFSNLIEYSSEGGKAQRAKLFLQAYQSCIAPNTKINDQETQALTRVACAIELIHNASLIHDDLPCMDNSNTRRGKASLHKYYSTSGALLAGDAIIAMSFSQIAKIPQTLIDTGPITDSLSKAFIQVCHGQYLEMNITENYQNKENALKNLMEIYKLKTASLFICACELGTIMAKSPKNIQEKMAEIGLNIGILYQILDDIKDYNPKEKEPNCLNFLSLKEAKTLAENKYKHAKNAISNLQNLDKSLNIDLINSFLKDLKPSHNT